MCNTTCSADFDHGTLIIDRPGQYKLCEDISFKPNPPLRGNDAATPPAEYFQPDFSVYDERAYGLGFFAAITIEAPNVDLFLNGHTIQQSREHSVIQRFYANIELASAPFIAGTGPHDFAVEGPGAFRAASNVRILGPGTIGRSAHQGIHGNENQNVEVSGVTFEDFEVAAVSLNNVDGLVIKNNRVLRNRKDVPVNGMFSAAHFITPYGKWLKDNYPTRAIKFADQREAVTAAQLYDDLVDSVNRAYNAVVYQGSCCLDELYTNQLGVVDGPWYVPCCCVRRF